MQRVAQFDETTTAFRLIRMLSELRQRNEAVAYGTTQILHSDDNVLVFKRQFFDKKVVVAVNRQPELQVLVPALNTTLPVGSYSDYLSGLLYGQSVAVTNVSGQNKIDGFMLTGGEVNVWSHNPSLGTILPRIGDVVSVMGRIGNIVRIYGTGLGGNPQVRFDTTSANVISASDSLIEVTVPNVTPGIRNITVTNNSYVSNPFRYEVLSGDQVQAIFHVNATTVPGQYIHVLGSIPELGNWNPTNSSESMMNPNYPRWFLPISVPAGTSFEFKFIKKDTSGNVIWEGGNNRVFTSPTSSTATIDTSLYYWQ